ncbi:MAG: Rdx family protein [Anaerolineaceae bacterium]|nr:Rdx family protein [Anaerolineaceae bacterium]
MMQFAGKLQTAAIKPSDRTGCFEVYLQDELVYSKLKIGRLPHPGEVEQIIMERFVK